jgi:hypothetical protein
MSKDDDWMPRPLDLLLGYVPGMKLPTNRGWSQEDLADRRPTEDAFHWRRANDTRHRARKLKDAASLREWKRQVRDDRLMSAARIETSQLIETGKFDMSDIPNEELAPATEALAFGVKVIRDAQANYKDRLSAARMILDFSMAKPAAKSEVTIARAEDWLNEIEA